MAAVHPSRIGNAKDDNVIDDNFALKEKRVVDTISCLSMDGVQKANSGHPGTPMAMAPVAYTIWSKFLKFDPQAPIWPNRDRFVLSMGHASMLIYSTLHLAGVKEVRLFFSCRIIILNIGPLSNVLNYFCKISYNQFKHGL